MSSKTCLLRHLIHSKIFNLTKCSEVLVKYSLLISHAWMPIQIWRQLRERLTGNPDLKDSLFQIINSLIESFGLKLTCLGCKRGILYVLLFYLKIPTGTDRCTPQPVQQTSVVLTWDQALFFLLLLFCFSGSREKTKQTTEIKGEGMIAGYGGLNFSLLFQRVEIQIW